MEMEIKERYKDDSIDFAVSGRRCAGALINEHLIDLGINRRNSPTRRSP
jgi:hypothetical protein